MTDVVSADDPLDLSLSETELDVHREHITRFVQAQTDAAGASEVVLGLSGGIDSTLTAHLAVEALGADAVYGLVLPSEVNSAENMSDAERVAETLDIEYDVVEIAPLLDAVLEALPGADPGDADASEDPLRTAVGNTRARIRAVLNYFVANRRGSLVLGTGNRSEALVGYFTKYGDGAVDCHPIGSLYKAQVRQLAAHVGVPADLAEKPASAELWSDQTDVGELGMDYPTLDSILALHVDGPLSVAATARQVGVPEDAVERVAAMVEHSAHKRTVPPAPDPLH
ncbi:NAD+ synthase [Halobacteriales archaeon Cl-PHB]